MRRWDDYKFPPLPPEPSFEQWRIDNEMSGMVEYYVESDPNNHPTKSSKDCPKAGCYGRIITTKIKQEDGWNGDCSDNEDEPIDEPLYRYHRIKQLIIKTCSCVFEGTCDYQAEISALLEPPTPIQGYSCDIEDELASRGGFLREGVN